MNNETKRRLLLSKWESDRETERDHEEEITERDEQIERLESVLIEVRYWMHDAQFRRSWPLLRKVERALGK